MVSNSHGERIQELLYWFPTTQEFQIVLQDQTVDLLVDSTADVSQLVEFRAFCDLRCVATAYVKAGRLRVRESMTQQTARVI